MCLVLRLLMHSQVVLAWNGLAIGAFANASRVLANEQPPPEKLFPVEGRPAKEYLAGGRSIISTEKRSRMAYF
jgi:hypothetical protein